MKRFLIEVGILVIVIILAVVAMTKVLESKFTKANKEQRGRIANCEAAMEVDNLVADPRTQLCFYSGATDGRRFIVPCSNILRLKEFEVVRHYWKVEDK